MSYLKVRNFDRYQHYKKAIETGRRSPTWIKLYLEVLHDFEFTRLEDRTKWLAIGLMLLAAKTDNHIPHDRAYIKRQLSCSGTPDIDALVTVGFIEVVSLASPGLAKGYPKASPEEKREEEKREEPPKPPTGGFDAFWDSYPRKIGKKAARKAWERAKDRPPLERITAAINKARATEQWRKDGGQFIPHPATWINQGRWDDDATPDASGISEGELAAELEAMERERARFNP